MRISRWTRGVALAGSFCLLAGLAAAGDVAPSEKEVVN